MAGESSPTQGGAGPPHPNDRVAVSEFNTDVLPVADRFAQWRESIQPVLLADVPPEDRAGFRGRVLAGHLGNVLIGNVRASGQAFRRDGKLAGIDGTDHFLVQLYTDGHYVGEVDDHRPIRVSAGEVCILDLTRSLQTRASAFSNITMVVPRQVMAEAVGQEVQLDSLHGTVLEAPTAPGRILGDHLRSIWDNLTELRVTDSRTVARSAIGLLAGFVGSRILDREEVGRYRSAGLLNSILRHIDANLRDPDLGPASILATFRVSRSTLYRLFEPFGGVSAVITRKRLQRCVMELTDPTSQRRIGEIAYDWGFASQAYFTRLFRQSYGVSPREARHLASMARVLSESGSRQANAPAEFTDWLTHL